MPDQTPEVVAFVKDRHPEISVEDITKCVAAFSDWVDLELTGGGS
jgi:hypothetical protein